MCSPCERRAQACTFLCPGAVCACSLCIGHRCRQRSPQPYNKPLEPCAAPPSLASCRGLPAQSIVYNSVLAACEAAQQLEAGMDVLDEMRVRCAALCYAVLYWGMLCWAGRAG